jgi:hypothetical protein
LLLFLWYWGLNSRSTTWVTLPALFAKGSQKNRVLWNYLPRLTSNHDPPDLCLLSS